MILLLFWDLFWFTINLARCYIFGTRNWIFDFLTTQGPMWIKIGQIVSHRKDLFSSNTIKQLNRLTDNTPVVSFNKLNCYIPEQFSINKSSLLGAGCIAQTYEGYYNDIPVVVKISRPGVSSTAQNDIRLLKIFLTIGSFFSETIQHIAGGIVIDSIEKTLTEQCDLRTEASNMRIFRSPNCSKLNIRLPKLYYVSERVIIMERFTGLKIDKFVSLYPDLADSVIDTYNCLYKLMVFVEGNFHADLHSGNFLVEIRNGVPTINLYDFGMLIRLSGPDIELMHQLFYKTVMFDIQNLANIVRFNTNRDKLHFQKEIDYKYSEYITNLTHYKSILNSFDNQTCDSVDSFNNLKRIRGRMLRTHVNMDDIFALINRYRGKINSEIVFCIVDFDRLLRFSVQHQSKNYNQCFLRSFLILLRMNLFKDYNYSQNILHLSPFLLK